MTNELTYRDVMQRLVGAGYKAYLVGGAVRNAYLDLDVKDYDVVTSATPHEVMQLFPGSKIINGNFSVSVYVPADEPGGVVEVATMRSESDEDYSKGKPTRYVFTDDINADLARRDMTFNAIAMDVDGNITDPFGGRADLTNKKVVAIGDPAARITAHPIRMMRYARFATSLGDVFKLDEKLIDAIKEHRILLVKESWDAISKEFMKGLSGNLSHKYLLTLYDLGLLEIILPEVHATYGVTQNIHHDYKSVWQHTIMSLAAADEFEFTPTQKLGVILHDVGKPGTRKFVSSQYGASFYNHEQVGTVIADDITHRLRIPEDDRLLIRLSVRYHMYPVKTTRAAKKLLGHLNVGGNSSREEINKRAAFLMTVRLADTMGRVSPKEERLTDEKVAFDLMKEVFSEEEAFRVTDLKVNGHDIMEALDMQQGVAVGNVLNELLEMVVDGQLKNEREALLDEARRIHGIGTTDSSLAGTA